MGNRAVSNQASKRQRGRWLGVSIACAASIAAASLSVIPFAAPAAAAADGAATAGDTEAKKIFNQRCTACHTYGKGIKVGPDLKGVTKRRSRAWLLKFIRSSQTVIASGDETAKNLFQQFKKQRMPDWTDLSEAQINAVLDWFAKAGPEQKSADVRGAETATPAEVERGRALFFGDARLASGGLACAGCHEVREGDASRGGSLGPPLTTAYAKYRDRALTTFFQHPCFRREPDSSAAIYLKPDELFALKAYLRKVAVAVVPTTPSVKRDDP